MSNDRTVRSLIALQQSASTARVLNLHSTHRKTPPDPDLETKPFFRHRVLDRGIVLKHRVRPHERELFHKPRPTTTKILIPMDGGDLRHGARYLLMGERDFDRGAEDLFGETMLPGQPDRQILDLIDELPSLDPFLLREHLKRNGFEPARSYFAITDADILRMYEFVRQQVMALVTLSAGEGGGAVAATKLVEKLLSNSADAGFEPLKETLRLSDKDYQDGVFCWRGFLYYKWVLAELKPQVGRVLAEIQAIMPRGPRTPEISSYLPQGRERIGEMINKAVKGVDDMLQVYDNAYASLTMEGKPTAFRDFLLAAPEMFMSLGEQCGAIQHVVSFWRYRFPRGGRPQPVSPEELMDIFLDFEDSLVFSEEAALEASVLQVA